MYTIKWKSDKERLEKEKIKRQKEVEYLKKHFPPKELTIRDIRELMRNGH